MSATTSRPYDLIIYDLDGTLLDSFADIAEAINHGLTACDLPTHSVDVVKTMVGGGINRLVEQAIGEVGADRFGEVLRITADYYKAHPAGHSHLFDGVPEALAELRARGFKQAILTNKPHTIALDSCDRVGLGGLVDFIQGEDAGNPLKPHPDAGFALARRFGAAPSRCLMVGDGQPDFDLARACGMAMAGCAWGVLTRTELAALRPEFILQRIVDLPLLPALA